MKSAKEITDPHGLKFLAAVKGVPASIVTYVLTVMTPGTNWRGCTKGHIAQEYAYSQNPIYGRMKLASVDLDVLARRCKARMAGDPNWRTA